MPTYYQKGKDAAKAALDLNHSTQMTTCVMSSPYKSGSVADLEYKRGVRDGFILWCAIHK